MGMNRATIIEETTAVLLQNDRSSYTVPAEGLYPHQWLWDSCFIAIGLRHIDVSRAQTELKSLLRGQWSNGMLPNMIFAGDPWYNRDRNIWRSHLSPFSPDDYGTSGITQPPLLAEAVVQVGQKLKKPERRSWYQTMYPALLRYHLWLYADRTTPDNALVTLIHPYECGLDDTPPWIRQLHGQAWPWWATVIEKTKLDQLARLFRRDTRHLPDGQRMNNLDALLYYYFVTRLRRKRYNGPQILKKTTFALDDLGFNCIFIRANTHLQTIATDIGKSLPVELTNSMRGTEEALDELWDAYKSQYFSRAYHTKKLIREPTIATLLPLYAGNITQERAEQLVDLLHNRHIFGADYPAPSVPFNSAHFQPLRYWQGPMWLNTNWLIIDGLRRYGFTAEADIMTAKSLEVVEKHGSYEYFSPIDGTPAGAKNFSWTAALALDLAKESR